MPSPLPPHSAPVMGRACYAARPTPGAPFALSGVSLRSTSSSPAAFPCCASSFTLRLRGRRLPCDTRSLRCRVTHVRRRPLRLITQSEDDNTATPPPCHSATQRARDRSASLPDPAHLVRSVYPRSAPRRGTPQRNAPACCPQPFQLQRSPLRSERSTSNGCPVTLPRSSARRRSHGHCYAVTVRQDGRSPTPRPRRPDRGPATVRPGPHRLAQAACPEPCSALVHGPPKTPRGFPRRAPKGCRPPAAWPARPGG